MTLTEQARAVKTRSDLAAFIAALRADFENNRSEWTNDDLTAFLEAMAGWIVDMDGFYSNIGESPSSLPAWRIVADILTAARMYE